jgi:hypothetical protein
MIGLKTKGCGTGGSGDGLAEDLGRTTIIASRWIPVKSALRLRGPTMPSLDNPFAD